MLENECAADLSRLDYEATRLQKYWKDQIQELCKQFAFCRYEEGGNVSLYLKNIENEVGQDMEKIKFVITDAKSKSASLAKTIEDNREAHQNLMRPVIKAE